MVVQTKQKTVQEQEDQNETRECKLPPIPRLKPTAKVGRLIVDLMCDIEANTRSRSGRKKKNAEAK